MRTRAPAREAESVVAAVKHLRGLAAVADAYRFLLRPAPGSAERAAIRAAKGNDGGQIAELLLLSADYHLLTFAAALSTDELYPLGGYTLLRGAAEPAARAAWLMDPKIGPRDRLGRVLVERLYSLQQQALFKEHKKFVKGRINALVEDAAALGLKAWPSREAVKHFGQERPGATNLFARLLPDVAKAGADPIGADVYKWLSGYTHSVPWAIFSQGQTFAGDPGFRWLRLELRTVFQLVLLEHVLRLHDIAHARLAGRIGKGEELWKHTLASVPPPPDVRALLVGL